MDEMQKDQLQSQDESLHSNQGADAGQGEALAPSPAVSAGESMAGTPEPDAATVEVVANDVPAEETVKEAEAPKDEAVKPAAEVSPAQGATEASGAEGTHEELHTLSFAELVERLRGVVSKPITLEVRNAGRAIHAAFYRNLRSAQEAAKKRAEQAEDALEEGFEIAEEAVFKELYGIFKKKVSDYAHEQEKVRAANLEIRREIVRSIGELTQRAEVKDETFKEFKQLVQRWREVGPVPAAEAEGIFQSFYHQVESFYAYIKINRELRDLDYKKNLDEKTQLCEQAEDMIAAEDISAAFKTLQSLHAKWKEVGPVSPDKSDEIWARFSAASARINSRHKEYMAAMKSQYEANLASKEALCAEVEAILQIERKTTADWLRDVKLVVEIQQRWRAVGPAPRKQSDKVWNRFQGACEQFFTARREFDKQLREIGRDNLQQKLDLCLQAEALKDSEDWKNSVREMIELQAKWKSIGYTPYKRGNELWQRFQAAQNHFFERRNSANSQQRNEQNENLRLKREILEELANYQVGEDPKAAIEWLKGIQARWSAIGFVPLKHKDELQMRYRELLDKLYDALRLEAKEQHMEAFKQSLDEMAGDGTDLALLQRERTRLRQRAKALENEQNQMETNMGFFTASSANDPIVSQLQTKLKALQEEVATVLERIKLIDRKVREASKQGE